MTATTDSQIRRTDMVIHTILFVVAVLTAGTLIMAIVSFRSISDQRATAALSRRDVRLVACQSLWRVDVSEAASELQLVWVGATPLTADAIEALGSDDPVELRRVLDGLRVNAKEIDGAVARLEAAHREYRAAIEASIKNPDRFLEDCKGRAG